MSYLTFIYPAIALVIGLSFGSFANVCIYRLPKNKQVLTGRSYCPKCKKKIKWFDNIPLISFLSLDGKCRSCKKKISPQYFIVELIAGLGFLFIFLNYDNHLAKLLLIILLLMYLIIFFIDLKHFIIPDILNYGIIVIAFLKNFLPDLNLNFVQDIKLSLMGGIAGFFSIWIIIYLYKTFKKTEGMGMGDAKLIAGVGLLLGWQSIPFVLFLSATLGLLMVMPSLLEKRKSLKSKIPFGPYIITAGVIYFLYGDVLYKMALGI